MKKNISYITTFLFVILLQWGCTEPFEIESIDYESVLVVESTITNEMKYQEVKLSKTSTLENPEVLIENNATVSVTSGNGNIYHFFQDPETGTYISEQQFQAEPNVEYALKIVTQNGRSYSSSAVKLPPTVEMDKVYAERVVDATSEKDGIQVLVDTEDPTGNAKYFRYEYEETYKIVAPYPSPYTAEIIDFDPISNTYEVVLTPRTPQIVCYSSENSTGISQTATTDFNENRVFRFPARYLDKSDPKLQTRYSILVKQYVQSIEAYTFYKTIEELGSVGSLLSQGQPGYIAGNLASDSDSNEKVLGFFEVSSVSAKRIYFNYQDFGLEKPPYFVECEVLALDYLDNTTLDNDPNERDLIRQLITYYDYQVVNLSQLTIYTVVQQQCSVCTSFSSNVKPDFWQD